MTDSKVCAKSVVGEEGDKTERWAGQWFWEDLKGLDELRWRLWLRSQPEGLSLVPETSGTELYLWSCSISCFYLTFWLKTRNTHLSYFYMTHTRRESSFIR